MTGSKQKNEGSQLVSGHRRRGRIAIEVGLGFFWLLGIAVGVFTLCVLVALATQNPLTLGLMAGAGAAGVGLPPIFLSFPHVRAWFLGCLERAAKWFLPDPKPVSKLSTDNDDALDLGPVRSTSPASTASSSPEPGDELLEPSEPSIKGEAVKSPIASPIHSHNSQATLDDVRSSILDEESDSDSQVTLDDGMGSKVFDEEEATAGDDEREQIPQSSPPLTTSFRRASTVVPEKQVKLEMAKLSRGPSTSNLTNATLS